MTIRVFKLQAAQLCRASRIPVLLAALCTLLVFGPAAAQTAVVEPANAVLSVQPGQAISATIKVINSGNVPNTYRLYAGDWFVEADGSASFADFGSTATSVGAWLAFPQQSIALASGEGREFEYSLTVPSDAQPGTYLLALFAEGEPTNPVPGQTSASISVRVAHVVFVNVLPIERTGSIEGLFVLPPQSSNEPLQFYAQYLAGGNAYQVIAGSLTVIDASGREVGSIDVPRSLAFANQIRTLEMSFYGQLPAGNYTALLLINYGSDEQEVAGAVDFVLDTDLSVEATDSSPPATSGAGDD